MFPPFDIGGRKVGLWKCEVVNMVFVQIVQLMVIETDGGSRVSGDITHC